MSEREQLLKWIAEEEEAIIGFFQEFVRRPSPNPPGDTTEAVAHIKGFLDSNDLAYRIIDPQPLFANVVASFDAPARGATFGA